VKVSDASRQFDPSMLAVFVQLFVT